MKFVDTLTLTAHAGRGGNGCVSFRREKYVPRGGPDGGGGGNGGNVIVRGDNGKHTLLDLRYTKLYNADDGGKGQGRDKTGRSGKDLIILVPFGTLIIDEDGNQLVDISDEQPEYILAKGGRGGRGNSAFASATQRTPRVAEEGTEGERITVHLELKLIADVGIVGYPNAGKSTFISVVSAAKPKVADYPFTTLAPVLGVVKNSMGGSFVIADMPGLIEGAHKGTGLGLQFLRHIERTGLLLHFVDASIEESMIDRYEAIRKELSSYSQEVAEKPEIVVATKVDAVNQERLDEFIQYMDTKNKLLFTLSSIDRSGVDALIKHVEKTVVKS